MKRLTGILMGILVVSTAALAAPRPVNRNLDERLFGAFLEFRAELGLTEDQNVAVDDLLNEMKEARIAVRQRELQHVQQAFESFISDEFDPRLLLPLPDEVREELQQQYNLFMAEHTVALHDILTPEQRQLLVDLMAEAAGGDE